MKILLALLFFVHSTHSWSQNHDLKDSLYDEVKNHKTLAYKAARQALFNKIYLQQDQTGYFILGLYCQKKFYHSTGSHPGQKLPDASVFNTEHVWPQSKFSTQFAHHTQKSDLHHLLPTFSRINSERGNLPFAEVNNARKLSCENAYTGTVSGDGNNRYFEPPPEARGDVARAMFYFSVRYKLPIDDIQEEYLRRWHKEDEVDAFEREKHEAIATIQKNRNPFIDNPALVDEIPDF